MNKFGWFLTGFYISGMIVSLYLSYLNVGDVDIRLFIFVWGLVGIGYNLAFLKDKKEGKTKC